MYITYCLPLMDAYCTHGNTPTRTSAGKTSSAGAIATTGIGNRADQDGRLEEPILRTRKCLVSSKPPTSPRPAFEMRSKRGMQISNDGNNKRLHIQSR